MIDLGLWMIRSGRLMSAVVTTTIIDEGGGPGHGQTLKAAARKPSLAGLQFVQVLLQLYRKEFQVI